MSARRWAVAAAAALAVGGVVACSRILGLRGAGPRPFEHRAHLLAGVTCVQCHGDVQDAGDSGPLHLPGAAVCTDCHRDPHDRRRCGRCHGRPDTASSVAASREHLRFEHRRHFPVVRGNCVRCHAQAGDDEANQRPPMAACLSCHHHRDQFAVRECEGCHVALEEEGVLPSSHVVHGPDFRRGHGVRAASFGDLCATCHTDRFCASCHGQTVPALPSRLAFDDPFEPSVHRAGFRARHAEEARAQPARCGVCHAESFCRACHAEQRLAAGHANGSPHPAGWVGPTVAGGGHGRAARRDPFTCASCHGGAGEALCVECHRVGGPGGSPHPRGFRSRLTRRDQPCRRCHEAGP